MNYTRKANSQITHRCLVYKNQIRSVDHTSLTGVPYGPQTQIKGKKTKSCWVKLEHKCTTSGGPAHMTLPKATRNSFLLVIGFAGCWYLYPVACCSKHILLLLDVFGIFKVRYFSYGSPAPLYSS